MIVIFLECQECHFSCQKTIMIQSDNFNGLIHVINWALNRVLWVLEFETRIAIPQDHPLKVA